MLKYILQLDDGIEREGELYYADKGSSVEFQLGPSLISTKNFCVYSNSPSNKETFLPVQSINGVFSLKLDKSGSYHYYFSYAGRTKAGSGYLLVNPELKLGINQNKLSLNGICMQSVLVKCLGPLKEWKERLNVSKNLGYNMIHFTPIQQLGESNSSYSIMDQLSLNSSLSVENETVTIREVAKVIKQINHDLDMLSVVDVVWNHTASNSFWLHEHFECSYNLSNTPHLKPAYLLDRAVFYLALEINSGKYSNHFHNNQISNECELNYLKLLLISKVIPCLRLEEFFQVDINNELKKFIKAIDSWPMNGITDKPNSEVKIIQDANFNRYGSHVDIEAAVRQFYLATDRNKLNACKAFEETLQWLNKIQHETVQGYLNIAIQNIINTVVYERLSAEGPKIKTIDECHPLVTRYFYHPFGNSSIDVDESNISDISKSQRIMAHNGWVMGQDALKNFAEYPSMVYLKRELVAWGDSIKLRYGKQYSDCPYLWKRMKDYTTSMAQVFHGIRIDNCHSTPLHVAEYMLTAARRVSPNLYVFAELFTGSEHVDNIFVNRLGITSLIRESINAHDSHELGRRVYMYGAESIGSFKTTGRKLILPSRAHAILYDITHDNESMIKKQSIYNCLPVSALVSMAACANGSNRGHDELVPEHIHVVTETRLYRSLKSCLNEESNRYVSPSSGMMQAKQVLNDLHKHLARDGYSQVYVDQRSSHVVSVTRHNPVTHHSYVLVAYTSFDDLCSEHFQPPPLTIEGKITCIPLQIKPLSNYDEMSRTSEFVEKFVKDDMYINGIDDLQFSVECNVPPERSCCKISINDNSTKNEVFFTDIIPGSIVTFKIEPPDNLNEVCSDFDSRITALEIDEHVVFHQILSELDLCAMNYVLFYCKEEQESYCTDLSVYHIPGWGDFKFCGIASIAFMMNNIIKSNGLGHAICKNLRDGNWLPEYISCRLLKNSTTEKLGKWIFDFFIPLSKIPSFLKPYYFAKAITVIYDKILTQVWSKMSSFIAKGNTLVKSLALGSVALCGYVKGASLPRLHADLSMQLGVKNSQDDTSVQISESMAAGLPHFSHGVMRCWGRDTFIAFHGLILVTGRHQLARNLLLSYAGCVRHGLIPNLLGEGKISRYNCRDAVWFWLQCIQDYCNEVENGFEILKDPVARIYPDDHCDPQPIGVKSQPLHDVIQEVLQKHVNGISFRERNAGNEIDSKMTTKGFDVSAGIDNATGFVYGGNQFNCGTWCDKMGESKKAGNLGVPATPRDGSAIELVAMCKSTVRWLEQMHRAGYYPYDGVDNNKVDSEDSISNKLTWIQWDRKLMENFEKHFYVSDADTSDLVHKRFIYKDTFGASHPWCDYQLRPNFCVAMVYAPELFDAYHAWKALDIAQTKLLGPLGMKTLDPDDMMYRGDYDNSNDSMDRSVAKGFNYHQGPEWLWPVGYFLRAKLLFASKLDRKFQQEAITFVQTYLTTHAKHLEKSEWFGLPELTNKNGAYCRDSCPIQAWSHATILDVLHDLSKMH